ncbi:MAG TPA: hypothetical protein VFT45_00120 [Longimicrobium sp.]|nr:hypothetical protein [Longimicrobium sp.]
MIHIRLIRRVLYVVPVIGAMVFGTAQVFASTAPGKELACVPRECYISCGGAGGVCSYYGKCICR